MSSGCPPGLPGRRADARLIAVRMVFVLSLVTALSADSKAIERRRGVLRLTESPTCLYQCDYFTLVADSGYETVFAMADLSTTIYLLDYLDDHVELIGYIAGCGGCTDLMVTAISRLDPPSGAMEFSEGIPTRTRLGPNYPNPFNPRTHIRFSISNAQLVTLRVFDVLGRDVATLINEVKQPGTYDVEWDAGTRASGVYYCLMQAGRAVDTRKLILTR